MRQNEHKSGKEAGKLQTFEHKDKRLQGLREKAINAGKIFFGDQNLVHPPITIDSVHVPQSPFGTYSIRIITEQTPIEAIENAEAILVGCMDARLSSAGDIVAQREGIGRENVLTLLVGGGIVQPGKQESQSAMQSEMTREEALQSMVDYILEVKKSVKWKWWRPKLKRLVLTAHTSDIADVSSSPCGGVKHFCNEISLRETVSKQDGALQKEHGQMDLEVNATMELISSHASELLRNLSKGDSNTLIELHSITDALVLTPLIRKDNPEVAMRAVGISSHRRKLSQLIN